MKYPTTRKLFFGDLREDSHSFGLVPRSKRQQQAKFHISKDNAHYCSIIPTGGGKSTMVINNALYNEGSMIFVDLKGEIAKNTLNFRKNVLHQKCYLVDPFGVVDDPSDKLDPLEILRLPGGEIETESESIAGLLLQEQRKTGRDIYWPIQAGVLISSLIAHLASENSCDAALPDLVKLLYGDDPVYKIAALADEKVQKDSFAMDGITSFLSLPDGQSNTRFCVLSTAQAAIAALRSERVRRTLGPSQLLKDILAGVPLTCYLVMPAERLESHGVVLRIYLETLMQAMIRRRSAIDSSLLVVVDEAAQIGPMPAVKTISSYLRGSGVRIWTLWQDASQLASTYPDWKTILNNCSAVTLSAANSVAVGEVAAMAGVAPQRLSNLGQFEHLLCENLEEPKVIRVPQWWSDRRFAGRVKPLKRDIERCS